MKERTRISVIKTIRHLILVSCFTLFTISPLSLRAWTVQESIQPSIFTVGAGWHLVTARPASDMDFGGASDCVRFQDQAVVISDCQNSGEIKWKSDDAWQVTEAMAADLNHDGNLELAMLVWRPFKPWPIDAFIPNGGRIQDFHDNQGMSCHVILVGWDGDSYREMWAGSALVDPVFQIRATDVDGDGFEELIALEGEYDSIPRTGNLTVWEWSGFGFLLKDRVAGSFSQYGIVSNNTNVMILTN